MNKLNIAPSIIAADFAHIADDIAACEAAGADWLHVDVMDGHFVPTITIGPLFVEACKRSTKLPLNVHLMIENPDKYLEAFAKAGASHMIVHVETCPNLSQTVEKIKSYGCAAGIALNPDTSASELDSALPLADLVLVMTVNPGYSGQAFMPEMIGKVEEIRNKLNALRSKAYLEVDGGISVDTLPLMQKAGADTFVAGNSVFKHPKGIGEGIRELREVMPL